MTALDFNPEPLDPDYAEARADAGLDEPWDDDDLYEWDAVLLDDGTEAGQQARLIALDADDEAWMIQNYGDPEATVEF